MYSYDTSSLKAAQDVLVTRENGLKEAAGLFEKGFIAKLDDYAQDALKQGLRGVVAPKLKNQADLLEVLFSVNGYCLVLTSNRRVLLAERGSHQLAFKYFIYDERFPDATPFIEITLTERTDAPNCYEVEWYMTEGKGGIMAGAPPNEEAGSQAAIAVINFLNRFERSWKAEAEASTTPTTSPASASEAEQQSDLQERVAAFKRAWERTPRKKLQWKEWDNISVWEEVAPGDTWQDKW